jgi:hypothetical protein
MLNYLCPGELMQLSFELNYSFTKTYQYFTTTLPEL